MLTKFAILEGSCIVLKVIDYGIASTGLGYAIMQQEDEDWDWEAVMAQIENFEIEMSHKELLEKESYESFRKSLENMKAVNASICESRSSPTSSEVTTSRSLPTSADRQYEILKQRNDLRRKKVLAFNKDEVEIAIDTKIKDTFEKFRKSIEAVKVERTRIENADDMGKNRASLVAARQLAKLSSPAKSYHRIIVRNLRSSVTQSDIEELFADIGELFEARLTDHGRAEVIFSTLVDAEKAIKAFHNRSLDGQLIQCELVAPSTVEDILVKKFEKLSVKESEPVSSSRIVISNLHSKVTQDDIEELFSDIGELHVARLIQPGLAEVVYKSEKNAQKAVQTFFDVPLDGRPIKCWIDSN